MDNCQNLMIKENKLLFLVFVNSLLAFVIDFSVGFKEFWLLLLLTEVPILIIIFLAMKGQRWAYVLTIIYYFLRSFNFYFPDFYLMTKNGLNFEFSVNSIGINVVSLILFLLLFYDLKSRFDSSVIKIIRGTVTLGLILTIVAGLLTPKDEYYDSKNELTIELDTTATFGEKYSIEVPDNWETATNYRGTSLFALSPVRDSLDRFRENFNIQVFNINFDIYSSEKIANKLYEQGISEVPYEVELLKTELEDGFYTMEYLLSDSSTNVQSKLFCRVENGTAYSIIFSDQKETFQTNLLDVFEPILTSFQIE